MNVTALASRFNAPRAKKTTSRQDTVGELFAALKRSKYLDKCTTEERWRAVVAEVRETGVDLEHLPELLLHKLTGDGDEGQMPAAWKRFVARTKASWEMLLSSSAGGSKRSRSPPSSSRDTEDAWSQAHVDMRNALLAVQARDRSPPAEARAPLAPYRRSEAEQFTVAVRRTRTTPASALDVFRQFSRSDDATVTESYKPPFDRNDLFLSNVEAAWRLFSLSAAFTRAPQESVYPAVWAATICYHGPLPDSHVAVCCTYVTWVLAAEVSSFLPSVLSGRIKINDAWSGLIAHATVYGGEANEVWKRRFSFKVIDDTGDCVTEATLPDFMATLVTYIEQFDGLARTPVCRGFNHPVHLHARHRLIYEAGTIQAFCQLAAYNAARNAYEEVYRATESLAHTCVDTALTFFAQLGAYLLDTSFDACLTTTSSSGEEESVANELHALMALFQEHEAKLAGDIERVQEAYDAWHGMDKQRKAEVQRSFAAAKVKAMRDRVTVPRAVAALHAAVSEERFSKVALPLSALESKLKRVKMVRARFNLTWGLGGVKDAVQCTRLLRALYILRLYVPPSLPDTLVQSPFSPDTAHQWPQGMTKQITDGVLTAAWRKRMLATRPDKASSQTTTLEGQIINAARDTILPVLVIQMEVQFPMEESKVK